MRLVHATAVTAGALVLALGATPARAAVHSHADAVGDVVVGSCADPEDESSCTEKVDPGVRNGDIKALSFRHTTDRVVVRVRHRDLNKAFTHGHLVQVVTDEGLRREVNVVAGAGSAQPDMVEVSRPNGAVVSCAGVRASYDLANEVALVSVPRRCLGTPRWVRVGVGAFSMTDDFSTVRVDDGLRAGVGDLLAMSPRIRRG